MRIAFAIIALTSILGFAAPPSKQTVLLASWDECSSGPVEGYKLAVGQKSGTYDWKVDVGNRTSCALVLPPGNYYVAITAYKGKLESRPSNEAITSVP